MTSSLSKVSPNSAQACLDLEWSDGQVKSLPYLLLRRECPCAPCQDNRLASSKRPLALPAFQPLADAAIQLTTIEAIGNYAIGLKWADGHTTGIYPFEYLKKLG